MPKTNNYVYFDTCVFLAYFNQESDRFPTVMALMEDISKNERRFVLTSSLTVAEVSKVKTETTSRSFDPAIEEEFDKIWEDRTLIRIADVDIVISRLARNLIRSSISLKMVDVLHLATAQYYGVSEFLTYDDQILKVQSWFKFPIKKPYTLQPPLL